MRERRPSLRELISRAEAAEQWCGLTENKISGRNDGVAGKYEEKKVSEGEKSWVQSVKKMFEGRTVNGAATHWTNQAPTMAYSHCIPCIAMLLHMFHRKVHPKNCTSSKKSAKENPKEETKSAPYDALLLPQSTPCRGGIWRCKCHSNPPSFALGGNNSTGNNREYWIKTDADYLVLEL